VGIRKDITIVETHNPFSWDSFLSYYSQILRIMADVQQQSPVYVLQFGSKLTFEDTEWVLKKLTQKKVEGGAELTISCAPPSADQVFQLHCSILLPS